jgi:hypothetical protein
MNISDLISQEPASGLLFGELLLIWSASHYLVVRDEVPEIIKNGQVTKVELREHPRWLVSVFLRAFASALATAIMTAFTSWTVIGTLFGATLILPLARARIDPRYIPEFEIGANAVFVVVLFTFIRHYHVKLLWAPIRIDIENSRIFAASLIGAIVLFSLRGGTYIVRGVLDKTGTLPTLKSEPMPAASPGTAPTPPGALVSSATEVDASEYSRGRLIGNLERLLLLVIVAAGSYESLAFLAAAKSLIRSKDLENRDWAEYFLVGSLASVLVAVAGGLLIRQLLSFVEAK